MKNIRVVQVGLGPVGRMLTPFLLERKSLEIVGAVDIDPALAGKDLGEASGLENKLGVTIRKSLDEIQRGTADVAAVTTTSKLGSIVPTLEACARAGLHVVSTCEELVYPWTRQPDLSKKIDGIAKEHRVALLATGVNPGFLMDALAITATAISRSVERIRIERVQDASIRRLPFQQKIGVGLTVEQFRAKVESGALGHVGLTESMQMIAARMGWKLDRTEDKIEPVLAPRDMESALGKVAKGQPVGLLQQGRGWCGGEELLNLHFRAALGETESRDLVRIQGTPNFELTIPGGIHGDIATCAITTNAIPVITQAAPGLRTMIDLPPLSWWS